MAGMQDSAMTPSNCKHTLSVRGAEYSKRINININIYTLNLYGCKDKDIFLICKRLGRFFLRKKKNEWELGRFGLCRAEDSFLVMS
jgi:hypothetical protein